MVIRRALPFTIAAIGAASAFAQSTGPSVQGRQTTVAEAQTVRLSPYLTLKGNIAVRQWAGDYTFRDASGDIRVGIPRATFGARQIGPDDRVRVMDEFVRTRSGRYVWEKSLQPL